MGLLQYSREAAGIAIDDRTLCHLHVVMYRKLLAKQSFFLHLPKLPGTDAVDVWIDSTEPVVLTYASSSSRELNNRWIDEMLDASSVGLGVVVSAEPSLRPAESSSAR